MQPNLWKNNEYYTTRVFLCSLRYPACNAHAPHFLMWPTPLYNIYPHFLKNATILGKKTLLNKKCVLIFSTTFVWNISHSKKKWARCDQKCVLFFMKWALYFCLILMRPEFSTHIFEKSSNTKFHKNPSIGSIVVPCGMTDRRSNMTKLIVTLLQICKRAQKCVEKKTIQL
jgi:hypothetical protein